MQDWLLLAAAAAIFVFGWFFIKNLDYFLERNHRTQTLQLLSGEDTLRIGFSNPLVADSMTHVLEQYSKQYPDIFVCLLHGSAEELMRELSTHQLDVVFLPEHIDIPAGTHDTVQEILQCCIPVILKYGELSIGPLADGHAVQNVLWQREIKPLFVSDFIECLKGEFAALKPQK